MPSEHFVGRTKPSARLRSVLKGEIRAEGKLTIQSIEGPGGIGKSFLFNHIFDLTDLSDRRYLRLKVDGNDPSSDSLVRTVSRMVDSADAEAIRDRPPGYYFTRVDRVSKVMDAIRADAMAEFDKAHPYEKAGRSAVSRFLDLAFEAGKRTNDVSPVTRKFVNFKELEGWRPLLEESIPTLNSLREENPRFFEKMGFGSTALRNSIKENACRPLADAVVSDLSAILSRYRSQDKLEVTHGKVKGIDRLLLILDDYEKLQHSIGEFLVGYLLPQLRGIAFESVVIILGRDQLEATHPAWDQHLKSSILPPLVLDPLSREEMDELVASYGVAGPEDKDRAWRDTQGYPFYVQLWIEEAESGGRTAIMLKRFYDRTTRWMTERERGWLHSALFVKDVNIRTLRGVLEDPSEAEEAFRWFEREGSVRDTVGSSFQVREYLRSRLIDYLKLSDPDLCEELQRKALFSGGSEVHPDSPV